MSEDSNRNLDKNHDQLNKKHSVSSPDSAVSFLLTSVGSSNSCSNSLIRYKDKLYSSASEALEAYIADFDLSLTSSEITTGKICLCQSTPKQAEFSKHRVKEKYGMFSATLDDCNEHTGLSSLASPCRRETECDPDLISLATDDLLAFPADGSLPCVPSSPFKSIHQNKDRLELLTLRADRDLESSNEDSSNTLENGSSPSTTDILGAERSWENVLGAFKSPVPACCEDKRNPLPFPKADIIHKFLEDCLNDKNKENVFSGDHNPRPLEALKFQAIQGSSNPNEMAEQKEEFEKLFEKADAEFKLCDSEIIPPTNSIQKALHYVSCLKSLLEDTITKQEQSDDHQENKEENS
ncbi:lung adenoma susceptibility protein 2 isoform X6 [Oxyura jamaicensis]|uniref:lung adenoma susceptibility protein 2 isoform X6 n=1 Tax=Oxyura jamaicensis TaxID=8884 RepID=UPI0015A56BE6|nr:lung adenoma susceptibility protein 2 isoform X6 [Oxyura jamaicensis]